MVSISTTTVIGRASCGRIMYQKKASGGVPSICAASFCSSSKDCSAVRMMSVAKGSHCHATMMTMAVIG